MRNQQYFFSALFIFLLSTLNVQAKGLAEKWLGSPQGDTLIGLKYGYFKTSEKSRSIKSYSATSSGIADYFETNYYLEPGYAWIRLQMGLGNNLRLDGETYRYRLLPVSIQYERALKYNFSASAGIGAQLISMEEVDLRYGYYTLFGGINYHINLEPFTGIDYILPYVGVSGSIRSAFANGYDGDFSDWQMLGSVDLIAGVKFNYKIVGILLEVGSSDTSCARLGFFFAIN